MANPTQSSPSSAHLTLSQARYGKANVRVCKVQRNPSDSTQDITELTVETLLEGDIAASWTHADNANIVATDTQKQTVYLLAKQHPVNPPERFAATLAEHFLKEYPWMHTASAKVVVHRWTRLDVSGKPHPHSFMRDGDETRVAEAVARREGANDDQNQRQNGSQQAAVGGEGGGARGISITMTSGIKGLLLLKTTGSQFWGFHRDAYTRLPETKDRILSTEVEVQWRWRQFLDLQDLVRVESGFDSAWADARRITLEAFAEEDSPSVQNTMYVMSDRILAAQDAVEEVEYSLPNKHYFEIGEFLF